MKSFLPSFGERHTSESASSDFESQTSGRSEDVRALETDLVKIQTSFRPGDIVRAAVVRRLPDVFFVCTSILSIWPLIVS